MKKMISLIVPIYCEEKTIPEFYRRVKAVTNGLSKRYFHEIIYVNDGSRDNSLELLTRLRKQDSCVKIINLSRNFGHQIAVTAGMDYSSGDIVVIIDADLQDPPEFINNMLAKWEEGYKVVYAVRKKRKGESFLKRITAKVFYRVLKKISDTEIPLDTGDFRLIDRSAVAALKSMRENNRFLRGMVSWVGFSQIGIEYIRDPRHAGETNYPLGKMVRFAFNGITSFSEKPLIVAGYSGMIITFTSFLIIIYVLISKFINPGQSVSGWVSLLIAIIFFGGLNLLSLGVIGLYLGRMFNEIKDRPLYIIEEKLGFDKNK